MKGLILSIVASFCCVGAQAETLLIKSANLNHIQNEVSVFADLEQVKINKLPLVESWYEVTNLSSNAVQSLLANSNKSDIQIRKPVFFKPQILNRKSVVTSGVNNPPYREPVLPPNQYIKDPKSGANWNIPLNGVRNAWKYSKGAGVVVAVTDTGIDYNHADLANNIWKNSGEVGTDTNGVDKRFNGIDDDKNGYVDDFIGWDFAENDNLPYDDHSHGTHVSGIIAATEGNGIGLDGVAPKATIMPLRFITANGGGSDADAIRALEYAAKMGANVINCSWGGGDESPLLLEAFKKLEESKIMMVIAAGNDGKDLGAYSAYPAKYVLKNGITVAANNTANQITWWSNASSIFVHNSAAGYEITSTLPDDSYGAMSGTSMAAPQVSAAVALLMSYRPNWTITQIRDAMAKHDMYQKTNQVNDPSNGIYTKYTKWYKLSHPGVLLKWASKQK